MQRHHLTIPQGAHQVEEVVVIEGDESPVTGTAGFAALVNLLRTVLDNPTILRHAHDCPTELTAKQNGKRWHLEARSVISVNNGDSSANAS
jgi:hypothetical protein